MSDVIEFLTNVDQYRSTQCPLSMTGRAQEMLIKMGGDGSPGSCSRNWLNCILLQTPILNCWQTYFLDIAVNDWMFSFIWASLSLPYLTLDATDSISFKHSKQLMGQWGPYHSSTTSIIPSAARRLSKPWSRSSHWDFYQSNSMTAKALSYSVSLNMLQVRPALDKALPSF